MLGHGPMRPSLSTLLLASSLLLACKSAKEEPTTPVAPAAPSAATVPAAEKPAPKTTRVGLVLSLGGRGDQSFNDSALRGLEEWAAGVKYEGGSYRDLTPEERQASLQGSLGEDLARRDSPVEPLGI